MGKSNSKEKTSSDAGRIWSMVMLGMGGVGEYFEL